LVGLQKPGHRVASAAVKPEFVAIYDDHVWDVYGFLAYRLNSREQAEDLTQATFERALRAWGRFDPSRSAPKTWLLAIANNLLIDFYRADKSSRQSALDDEVPESALPSQAGPESDLGLSAELAAALQALTQRDRHVVALRFGGDLTGPEIAEMLDLTLANVQQILSRALRRMRSLLEEADPEPRSTSSHQA
jgi:RNA polymerase sigma-70 factor (ECF subfamily)